VENYWCAIKAVPQMHDREIKKPINLQINRFFWHGQLYQKEHPPIGVMLKIIKHHISYQRFIDKSVISKCSSTLQMICLFTF
jgi:hypothetical protein